MKTQKSPDSQNHLGKKKKKKKQLEISHSLISDFTTKLQ